ncbi:MAG TPA: NCS1 family nucleobase:cation symporter-1 [Solirubrobacteraceae bacterium]|nr:NCS1 family nucleobase:cation symporter-1 [Solirubrobacteraceae bacterium]
MTDRHAAIADSPLSNGDLAPTTPERRTWGTYHLAALWIGLSIVITTYTLASGLIAAGMTWWQGLMTVSLGNLIVLVPILLNGSAGTRYGIPFPVLVRSSFGIRGANVAAMARALVACGWFGIQTWIGALALDTLMTTMWGGWADVTGHKAIAFGVFWIVQVAIILRGIEGIKFLESWAAPLLLGSSLALLIWAFGEGGGIGNVFSASARLIDGESSFWSLFGPGLAANVGYWITLSMNIPDFTRYAKDQRSQVVGQSIAMPLTMTGFSFIGIAVTSATVVIYGEAIWDPVTLVARLLDGLPVLLAVAMVIVVIAQISTNMAANVVSPSFDFSNLSPRRISFRTGGLITAFIGIVSFPWKLYEDVGAYIFTWLVGYGSLLASFLAVMLFDYWLLRRARLDLTMLYEPSARSPYWFSGGYNVRALVAVAAGVIPVLPGFLNAATTEGGVVADPGFFDELYRYGVFVAFGISALAYVGLSLAARRSPTPAPALEG